MLECDNLPGKRSHIATPEIARSIPHLKHVAHLSPPLDPKAEVLLLLGIDAPDALATHGMIDSTASSSRPGQEHFITSEDNPVLEATVFQTNEKDNDAAKAVKFADKMNPNEHNEIVPALKKSEKISLNKVLLTGPDPSNNLLEGLICFKQKAIGLLRATRRMSTVANKQSPAEQQRKRESWHTFPSSLQNTNAPVLPDTMTKIELHVFSDASTQAIAAIAYTRIYGGESNCQVQFLLLLFYFPLNPFLDPAVPVPAVPDLVPDPATPVVVLVISFFVPVLVPVVPVPMEPDPELDPVTCPVAGQKMHLQPLDTWDLYVKSFPAQRLLLRSSTPDQLLTQTCGEARPSFKI